MRRIFALALMSAFLLQPVAASSAPRSALVVPLHVAFFNELALVSANVQAHVSDSFLFAVATGTLSRYALMHAAAPTFERHPVQIVAPAQTRVAHRVAAFSRGRGIKGSPPHMLSAPILPRDAKADPLAEQRSAANGVLALSSTRGFVRSSRMLSTRSIVAQSSGRRTAQSTGPATAETGTGINRWWTYEEGSIPGVGRWMLNVGTGNLLVQDDDIDVPERGIDLAFRRTYNNQSDHDVNNDDGSVQSNYGNGWTNTFDAHMGYNSSNNTLIVYDIDGAAYVYSANGSGGWNPPPGIHTTLTSDGGCGYFWTKKTGTVYYFYGPVTPTCTSSTAYAGRLYQIWGRNHNNAITFSYSWLNGDDSSANNLTEVVAQHSDGQALTLLFSSFNGHDLLSSIERPDGATVTFAYDQYGNLTDVYDLGNNAATGATPLHHEYAYYGTGSQMYYATSPNWTMGPNPGAYVAFAYDSSNRATQSEYIGIINFTPSDGTGVQLQAGYPTTGTVYRNNAFAYGSGQTTFSDTDGHATIYTYDGSSRITETQDWDGSQYLTSSATWDSENNLTATTDARGNESDYAYDANGNTIAQALPAIATNVGTIRPTSYFSYDQFNNITAACDPVFSNAHGMNWSSPPAQSDSLCPSENGAARYTYTYTDTSEPYGTLTDSYSPCYGGGCAHAGKHVAYTYNTADEGGGDYGLPTTVAQDCFSQYDGSQVCPSQAFAYGAYGNLTSYNPGEGAWTLAYDSNNRVTSTTDADGITTRKCYEEDGSVEATQTAAQYANDGGVVCGSHSTSYTYDDDGNALTTIHHFNNEASTTTDIYDGDDRVVEVDLPHDSNDKYNYTWMTRNLYDLSQGGTLSIGTQTGVVAHGNLYKTQEWVGGSPTWTDLKGDGYDAMDRIVNQYSYQPGTSYVRHTTNAYDQSAATYGLLTDSTDALGEITTPTYDADGNVVETSYSNDGGATPSETVTFDPDGRAVAVTSSSMGEQSTTYDADGQVTAVQEASGGGVTSPASYAYGYYADGQRANLSVSSSSLTQSDMLQYAYRTDGLRSKLAFTYGANAASWAWGRSNAGRTTSIADSSGQPTRTITYDAEGRVATDTMPSGESSNFQYDDEGEVLGYTTPNNDGSTATTIGYTVRGEFASQTFSGAQACSGGADVTLNAVNTQYANGVPIPEPACPGSTTTWDARTGAMETTGGSSDSTSYSYDAAGRQSLSSNPWSVTWTCGDQQCSNGGSGERTRTYDAQNHLIGDAYSQWSPAGLSGCVADRVDPQQEEDPASGTLTYKWGPNGHADLWGGGGSPGFNSALTLHWDGNTPLFITDASGTLQEIKIEGIGFYAPSASPPMTFLDRDQTGFVVASHSSSGPGLWTAANPFHQTCDGVGISGYALFEPGPDGITDTVNTIQGVRAYDPAMGTWTAPDAYAGDASDPMSHKSYMWDRNNAFAYSDPTGYIVCHGCNPQQSSELKLWAEEESQAVTAAIAKLDPKKDKAEIARLTLFNKDLAWNNEDWTITPGALGGTVGANTGFNYWADGAMSVRGGTTLDFAVMMKASAAGRETVLSRDGGIHEISEGHAGRAVQSQFVQAYIHGYHLSAPNHYTVKVTNEYYNRAIGVPDADY